MPLQVCKIHRQHFRWRCLVKLFNPHRLGKRCKIRRTSNKMGFWCSGYIVKETAYKLSIPHCCNSVLGHKYIAGCCLGKTSVFWQNSMCM